MSTVRARSALLTWGAVLFAGTLLVTACTGDPVATGTVPVTSSVVSTSDVTTTAEMFTSAMSTSTANATADSNTTQTAQSGTEPSPIVATVPTIAPSSPAEVAYPSLNVPEGARQETAGGASDFVKWWYELGTASINARDSATLREFSSDSCGDCSALLVQVEDYIHRNLRVESAEQSWTAVIQADLDGPDRASLIVYSYTATQQVFSADGALVETQTAEPYFVGIQLEWYQGHWILANTRPIA